MLLVDIGLESEEEAILEQDLEDEQDFDSEIEEPDLVDDDDEFRPKRI